MTHLRKRCWKNSSGAPIPRARLERALIAETREIASHNEMTPHAAFARVHANKLHSLGRSRWMQTLPHKSATSQER